MSTGVARDCSESEEIQISRLPWVTNELNKLLVLASHLSWTVHAENTLADVGTTRGGKLVFSATEQLKGIWSLKSGGPTRNLVIFGCRDEGIKI